MRKPPPYQEIYDRYKRGKETVVGFVDRVVGIEIRKKIIDAQKRMHSMSPEERVRLRTEIIEKASVTQANLLGMYNRGGQEDVTEFAQPILALMLGNIGLRSVVTPADGDYKPSTKEDPLSPLIDLPIEDGANIGGLLQAFQQEERITADNEVLFAKKDGGAPKKLVGTKKLAIDFKKDGKLPSEVFFSLKRHGVVNKNCSVVNIEPIEIDGEEYNPTAIVCHHGNIGGGHYISYIKESDGNWYKYDDRVRTRIGSNLTPEQQEDISCNAYLVKYSQNGARLPSQQGSGTINRGNYCYANSMLAFLLSLTSVPPLTQEEERILRDIGDLTSPAPIDLARISRTPITPSPVAPVFQPQAPQPFPSKPRAPERRVRFATTDSVQSFSESESPKKVGADRDTRRLARTVNNPAVPALQPQASQRMTASQKLPRVVSVSVSDAELQLAAPFQLRNEPQNEKLRKAAIDGKRERWQSFAIEIEESARKTRFYFDENLRPADRENILNIKAGNGGDVKPKNVLATFTAPCTIFLGNDGEKLPEPLPVVIYNFTYPRFSDKATYFDGNKLKDGVGEILEKMIALNIKAVNDLGVDGKKRPFVLQPPHAFIARLNSAQKEVVKKAIAQAFINVVNSQDLDASNIDRFIINNSESWRVNEVGAMRSACQSKAGFLDFPKGRDLIEIAKIYHNKGVECPLPLMGDGDHKIGNGAFGSYAENALEEFFTRTTNGCLVPIVQQAIKIEIQRGAGKKVPTRTAPEPLPIAPRTKLSTPRTSREVVASNIPSTPTASIDSPRPLLKSPATSVTPPITASRVLSKEQEKEAREVINNWIKGGLVVDSKNRDIIKSVDDYLDRQAKNPNPKGAYQGIGIKSTVELLGGKLVLAVEGVYAPERQRFNDANGGPSDVKKFPGQSIVAMVIRGQKVTINDLIEREGLEALAKRFHQKTGKIEFVIQDNKTGKEQTIGCKMEENRIFANGKAYDPKTDGLEPLGFAAPSKSR